MSKKNQQPDVVAINEAEHVGELCDICNAPLSTVDSEDESDDDRKHKAVYVRVGDQEAEIDAAIAPLIREMWEAGIETVMSCQEDGNGLVWIEFPSEEDLANFLDMVADYDPDPNALYNRIVHDFTGAIDPEWIIEVSPVDFGAEWLTDDDDNTVDISHSGTTDLGFWYSVRFPPSDLPVVLKRVRRYNRSRRRQWQQESATA